MATQMKKFKVTESAFDEIILPANLQCPRHEQDSKGCGHRSEQMWVPAPTELLGDENTGRAGIPAC